MVQQEILGKYLLHCFSVMGSFIDSTIGSILGGFQNPYNLIGSVGIRLGPFTPMLSGPLFSNPMSTNQSIAIEIGRGLAKIANPLPIRMN